MPSAIVIVKMSTSNGNEFTAMHCAGQVRGGTRFGQVDAAMNDDLQGPRIKSGEYSGTSPDVAAPSDISFIEMILRLHRGIHGTHVRIDQVYISDGKTAGAATGPFATIPLSLQCTSHYHGFHSVTDVNCAPLNVVLLVTKKPALFSVKGGRNMYRAAVRKEDTKDGTRDGATLTPAALGRLRAVWEFAEAQSGLAAFYPGRPFPAGIIGYCQAQFYNKVEAPEGSALEGILKLGQPVANTQLKDAAGRQTTRGKKKAPTLKQLAAALFNAGFYQAAQTVQTQVNVNGSAVIVQGAPAIEAQYGDFATDTTSTNTSQRSVEGYAVDGDYVGDLPGYKLDPQF